jgi:hypothetical protein
MSPCILVWTPWPQLGGLFHNLDSLLVRSSLQAFWEKRRRVSVLLPHHRTALTLRGNFSMKVWASQIEAASACSYGAGQRMGINYRLHMGRYNGPFESCRSTDMNLLLASVTKWEDMGCTLGTTPEYLLLLQPHEMQKPSVSQGLYPILLLALSALTTSAYTSLGVSQDSNPRPQLLKASVYHSATSAVGVRGEGEDKRGRGLQQQGRMTSAFPQAIK